MDADQSTGRIIHVPNGLVFNKMVASYSKGLKYLRNEIPVLVTFASDWEKTKTLLLEITMSNVGEIKEAAQEKLNSEPSAYLIRPSILDPIVCTTLKNSGVLLTIRYLCEPHQRRNTEQTMWEALLKEFAEHDDIEFAYPTQRLFYPDSGKPPKDVSQDGESNE